MDRPNKTVPFLFDVDNTLLDNDAIINDIEHQFGSEFGDCGFTSDQFCSSASVTLHRSSLVLA